MIEILTRNFQNLGETLYVEFSPVGYDHLAFHAQEFPKDDVLGGIEAYMPIAQQCIEGALKDHGVET